MKPVLIDPQTQRRHYVEVEMDNIIRSGTPVPKYLQDLVAQGVALNIPLGSPKDVARAAKVIGTLAWEVERIHRLGGPTASALLQVRGYSKAARKELASKG
jgi:hypothetical protein